jgi:thiaminase/transcriptional activator TenA
VDYREDLPRSLERRRSRESEYRQFVEHWTTPDFVDYVTSLEKAADDALRGSDKQEREAGRVSLSGGCPAGEGLLGDGLVEGSAMSLAKTLWEENVDLTWAALEHRFVRGLGDGDLPLGSFQEYVAQDAFFLEAFARAYALALAQSPDRQGLHDFVELLAGVLEELELHGKYAERWSVELADVVPGEATLAYTDFLLATAALRGVGETCAAMTPCMRLYAFLGQSLADEGVDENNAYAEWIETYSDPDFETLASTLEDLLDRYAADTPAVRAAYRRAMSLELAFFEANADGHSG